MNGGSGQIGYPPVEQQQSLFAKAGGFLSSFGGGGGEGGGIMDSLSGFTGAGMAESAMSAVSGLASGGPSAATSGDIAARTPIMIAPIGVNLGSIMLPMNQGSPENGGMGMDFPSRLKTTMTPSGNLSFAQAPGLPWAWIAAGGLGLALVGVLVLR